MIEFHNVGVAYKKRPVLWNVDLEIKQGSLVAIVGPNGAGKSTLLKAALGLVPLSSGFIRFNGDAFKSGQVGYVPQRENIDWDFPVSVYDVVLMSRYRGWLNRVSAIDKEKVLKAIGRLELSDLMNRQIGELSGGQQQRVFIARALAQEADIYFMDEPFAAVDAKTECIIAEILRELVAENKTVLCVHHDLQTVPKYFDYSLLLNVRKIAYGEVKEVFNSENLIKTYGGRLSVLEEIGLEMGR
jgi:manganese/zinc/iron transport system ATP- binding protein